MHVQFPENLRRVKQVLVLEYLLCVPCEQGQVEDNSDPVAVNHEQDRQESMDSGFRDDVSVKAVAEVDGIDVVAEVRVSRLYAWSSCSCLLTPPQRDR